MRRDCCLHDAAEYVVRHSWWARRNERWARRLALLAADELADGGTAETARRRCAETVRREVGHPILVVILLQVVLPIVLRLVIEWWNDRKL